MQADRLSHALNKVSAPPVRTRFSRFLKPKVMVGVAAVILVVGIVSSVGISSYASQAAAAEAIVVAEQQQRDKQKSAAAEACRQKKIQEKPELIGKVTYDELYNYDECDR